MDKIIFIHYWLVTLRTRFGTGFTSLEVSCKRSNGNIEITVFTKFRFEIAVLFVFFVIIGWENYFAMGASFFTMIFFFMIFFKVNVVELATGITLLNIATAVTEMCSHFRLRVFFHAVVTSLQSFCFH